MASSLGSVCGLPKGHTGPHGEPTAAKPLPAPRQDSTGANPTGVWPPTSERDAHLGAYQPFELPVCTVTTPHEHHTTLLANGGELVCFGKRGDPAPSAVVASLNRIGDLLRETLPSIGEAFTDLCDELDPVPSGLTAAQIRLDVFMALAGEATLDQLIADVPRVARMIEHGPDEMPILRWRRRAYLAEARLERALDLVSHRAADETVRVPPLVAALTWTSSAGDDTAACPDPGCACGTADTSQELTVLRNRLTQVTADRDALAGDLKGIERCPDPMDHKEHNTAIEYANAMRAKAERERDFSRAAAREDTRLRVVAETRVSKLIVECDTLAAQCIDAPAQVILLERQRDEVLEWVERVEVLGFDDDSLTDLRAIYAEHGGEPEPDPSKADILFADGVHRYWSTHCRHGHHDRCAATEFAPGVQRQPSQCKTEECQAPCRCECHGEPDHA
jgi:hypothetical protein